MQIGPRQLGTSGITVPALGVGVWSWGDTNVWQYGQTFTREDITQAYQVSLDAGLTFFDTAEIYGNGQSERILGDCQRKDGRSIIIASKFAPFPTRFSARTLQQALDASLERLGVEQIDLYQIHWPYTFLSVHSLMDALAQAVRSGKVRAVGVSNYSAASMRQAYARLARHDIPLASNQVHYNLLHRRPEVNGVLDACRELNVALIAYSPLAQGLLTGKFRANPGQSVQLTGRRRWLPAFSVSQRREMEPLLQMMQTIGSKYNKTIAQVALNWLLVKDDCIIPIPGAKNAKQATENAGALGWSLTEAEHIEIGQAAQKWLR